MSNKKGTNFKEFAATLRYPPIQYDPVSSSNNPLQAPRTRFLKDFATQVLNDVLQDLREQGLEPFANEYNRNPFKSYSDKIKEDELLRNPTKKSLKALLVDDANLSANDPLAEVLNDLVDSLTENVVLSKDTDNGFFSKTDSGREARERLLEAFGLNGLKLLGYIGLASIARSIPIEQLTQFNVEEYLKNLSPDVLMEKLFESIKDKNFQEASNTFTLVSRFLNSILTSSQFDSKIQQAFLDHIKSQPDLPESLASVVSWDEILVITNPDSIDTTDPETFKKVSSASISFMQNGKLGLDLKLVSRDANGDLLGDISLSSLSEDLTNLVTGAQDDLQSLFDGLENCKLPEPEMFHKYRDLGKAIDNFFRGFKPAKLGKKNLPKIQVPNRLELVETALLATLSSTFYIATTILFKMVLAYLQSLIPDISCAQLAAKIVPNEELGPEDQNRTVDPLDAARKIADDIRQRYRSLPRGINIDSIAELLANIANSVGLYNGIDIATLNEFISLTTSVLTEREYCELLSGNPTLPTLEIIRNIIDVRYPDAGFSKEMDDIVRFFGSISTFADPGCDMILTEVDLPVNGIFCATPEYYSLYNNLRVSLLSERGLDQSDIEIQINKVCEITNLQAQKFLDLLNDDNPIDSMIPLIQTGEPNCGPNNSIEIVTDFINQELVRIYTEAFEPVVETLDSNMIGDRGFISRLLSGKNGLAYPSYQKVEEIINNSLASEAAVSQLAASIEASANNQSAPVTELSKDYPKVSYKAKQLSSWMRTNLEEFCNLDSITRKKTGLFSTDSALLTETVKQRIQKIKSLNTDQFNSFIDQNASTFPVGYPELFEIIGDVGSGIRGLSYTGIYDLKESYIEDLTIPGTRQTNLSTKSYQFKKPIYVPEWVLRNKENILNPAGFSGPGVISNSYNDVKGLEQSVALITRDKKAPPTLPEYSRRISSKESSNTISGSPNYRTKSYNFFIFPINEGEATNLSIRTKIIDLYPSTVKAFNSTQLNANEYQLQQNEVSNTISRAANFMSSDKTIEYQEVVKEPNDYYIPINENTVSSIEVQSLYNLEGTDISPQAAVFADIVLKGIRNNLNIDPSTIPQATKYVEYLVKDLYRHTSNTFLDGIMKLPALNGKTFNIGFDDERINTLNLLHTNTITGMLDPVDPTRFGGTEDSPSFYVYKKLTDDWNGLYNLYTRESNETSNPPKNPVPDFAGIANEAARLYTKIKEETRQSKDYSNQVPFDLIVKKSSMVSMSGLIDMMIRVFCFEHYYKAFSFMNSVVVNDNIFDNVYYDFLVQRFKDYAVEAGPRQATELSKNKRFFYMIMEIYVTIMLRRKDAKDLELSQSEQQILSQILRKANIWKSGLPDSGLTDAEKAYFNAFEEIGKFETPGYPLGTITTGLVNTQGSFRGMNNTLNTAKQRRETQISLQKQYWNLIMQDCESLFDLLLRRRFKTELEGISQQLSILNPTLVKESNIIATPVNGGPFVQNGEDLAASDKTSHLRNVYSHHPAFLYSVGNLLTSDLNYSYLYGTEEANNDRNLNGFFFNRLYNKQPHPDDTCRLNSDPKEPVYTPNFNFNDPSDLQIRTTVREYLKNQSELTDVDYLKFNPEFLTPKIINGIELEKRNRLSNDFILSPEDTKAIDRKLFEDMIVFQYSQNLENVIKRIEDNQGVSLNVESSTGNMAPESKLKKYKVMATDGAEFQKLGTDNYIIGGESATNMPLVFSQTPLPITLEHYINLEPLTEMPSQTSPLFSQVKQLIDIALYNFLESRYGIDAAPLTEGVFSGPSSLSTFIYWLGSSGFFDSLEQISSSTSNAMSMSAKLFFKFGTFRYGVRMLLMQPDSDITFEEGFHRYMQDAVVREVYAASPSSEDVTYLQSLSDGIPIADKVRYLKAFSKETGYGIPIFKNEIEVDWTFADLKNIYDSYISNLNNDTSLTSAVTSNIISPDSLGRELSKGSDKKSWIDHSPLTRQLDVRLFNEMICSEDYKKMFDYAIPLRYFASLSAIYATKAFTPSIGSAIDWGGIGRVNNKVFPRKEKDILLPFYTTLRKVFYSSYNSFDLNYRGEGDENEEMITTELIEQTKTFGIRNITKETLVMISDIQNDILAANRIRPQDREGLGDLIDIIGTGNSKRLVPDPTNGNGSANNG